MTEESQLGPSYDGTVMLDIGGDVGALIIHTPEAMHRAEIEISPVGEDHASAAVPGHAHGPGEPAHTHADPRRTHVAVRERRGPAGVRYAAIYPGLHEGEYTVWDLDGRAAESVRIVGGEVAQLDWR